MTHFCDFRRKKIKQLAVEDRHLAMIRSKQTKLSQKYKTAVLTKKQKNNESTAQLIGTKF